MDADRGRASRDDAGWRPIAWGKDNATSSSSMGNIGVPVRRILDLRHFPHGRGTAKVVLTEQAEMKNPFFRVMIKIFGPTKYMDEHLQGMAKNFGETTVVIR